MNADLRLSIVQRDEIMAAVAAIGRQLRETDLASTTPALMVISTNLTIIHAALMNLPLAGS